MRLTKYDFLQIVASLEALYASKLNIQQFQINNHTITVERTEDQRDGVDYFVTEITPLTRKV